MSEIIVAESREKPVLAFGRAFKRVGKSSLKVDKDEHERMVLERRKVYFDSLACEEAKLSDIDEEKVKWFIKIAQKQRGLSINESVQVKEALLRLKMLNHSKLTNAAILLFAKDPQKFFLQAVTKAIRFKGIDVSQEMLDFKTIEGDIINQMTGVENFIFEHIPKAAWIEAGKLERQEKWLYPPNALREALANAFAHRDYESSGMIQVRIFDDRLEIWSPGNLPTQLTIDMLSRKHDSLPRNPLIAKAFFWIKFVEEVGTGTNKIFKWCKDWGLPQPIFEEINGVVVTFRKEFITEELLESFNDTERSILGFIKEKKSINRRECVQLLRISPVTAFRYLRVLENRKLIQKTGKGKNIRYVLV